jgi:hypothetical protein
MSRYKIFKKDVITHEWVDTGETFASKKALDNHYRKLQENCTLNWTAGTLWNDYATRKGQDVKF